MQYIKDKLLDTLMAFLMIGVLIIAGLVGLCVVAFVIEWLFTGGVQQTLNTLPELWGIFRGLLPILGILCRCRGCFS